MTDTELLSRYAAEPSDELFAELVRGHIDFVYSAARRQVRDPAMAADITQAVFILLAERAGRIRGSLAGWLIVTTSLTVNNAKKMQARRIKHERRAAQMKIAAATPEEPAEWASYAPFLDSALATLRESDRDVLVARYLQGKALRDVGILIGVSEEAARKRVDRALRRLRKQLSSHVPMPAATVLGSHLDHFGVQSAPRELVDSLIRHGAAVKSGTAASIVHEVRLTYLVVKAKIACVGLLVLLAGGAAAAKWMSLGEIKLQNAAPADAVSTAATAPVISTIDLTEANRPGEIQVVRWNVLLDPGGATALKGVGQNIVTPSKVYQAMLCNASVLRQAVSQEMDGGHVLGVAHDLELVPVTPGGRDPNHRYQLNFQYTKDNPAMAFYGGASDFDYDLTQLGVRRGRLDLDHRKVWIRVNEGGIGEKQTIASLVCSQALMPGQSIAFLGSFAGSSGRIYGHLVVWEAYAATARESGTMLSQRDAGWWCQHGPDLMRRWADQEYQWAGTLGGRPLGPPSVQRKLDDGESIWFFALIRPSKWPLCWWDPSGKPAGAWWNAFSLDGDLPTGLMAQVQVQGPGKMQPPVQPQDVMDCQETHSIPDDAKQFEVGVPIGPWIEVGKLKVGQTLVADGIQYRIVHDPNESYFYLQVTGVLNDDFRAIPVDPDGTQENLDQPRQLKWVNESVPRTYKVFLAVERDPASFIVKRRRRQYVTFDRFATNPVVPPPPCPAVGQDIAAIQAMRTQALQQYLKQFPAGRIGRAVQWFLSEPTDYFSANNLFLHAAVLGDEKTVRHLLMATDPGVAAHLGDLAHMICTGQSVRRAATERLGEAAAHELLDQPGLFEDIIAELMTCGWSQVISGNPPTFANMQAWDARLEPLTWCQAADGLFYLNVDGLAEWPDIAGRLERGSAKADRLQKLMAQHAMASVAEGKQALREP